MADNGGPESVNIVNTGKTSVTLYEIQVDGSIEEHAHLPQLIAQNTFLQISITDQRRQWVLLKTTRDNVTNDDRISIDCSFSVETDDKKKYLVPFTWTFIVRDGAIVRSFTANRAPVEIG